MLSAKVILISTGVLSAAVILSATDISVYASWIYNGVVSWLRPPYLYLVINCIIITVVASSKLQPTSDDASAPPSSTPLLGTIPVVQPQPAEIVRTDFLIPTAGFKYEGVPKGLEFEDSPTAKDRIEDSRTAAVHKIGNSWPIVNGADDRDDATNNKENEGIMVAKTIRTAAESNDEGIFVKPPASSRFGHRRNAKVGPEGGRTVLGVSKPKKQDTLENTWKTITEGRGIPISRHLKKSDTWAHGHQQQQENTLPLKTMRKAETFKDRSATNGAVSPASSGSGKARKEPSLSQDDLNKRVEAFIKNFNEDMRLQRQESLNQYTEMINRGVR